MTLYCCSDVVGTFTSNTNNRNEELVSFSDNLIELKKMIGDIYFDFFSTFNIHDLLVSVEELSDYIKDDINIGASYGKNYKYENGKLTKNGNHLQTKAEKIVEEVNNHKEIERIIFASDSVIESAIILEILKTKFPNKKIILFIPGTNNQFLEGDIYTSEEEGICGINDCIRTYTRELSDTKKLVKRK